MTLIVDANIIGKLFLQEDDHDTAREFFKALAGSKISAFAPNLLTLEVYALGIHYGLDVSVPRNALDKLSAVITLLEPNEAIWERAYEMAQSGHPKSGFPSLQDSIYHALAIETGGTFITADKKHIAKAKDFGHIAELLDWERYV